MHTHTHTHTHTPKHRFEHWRFFTLSTEPSFSPHAPVGNIPSTVHCKGRRFVAQWCTNTPAANIHMTDLSVGYMSVRCWKCSHDSNPFGRDVLPWALTYLLYTYTYTSASASASTSPCAHAHKHEPEHAHAHAHAHAFAFAFAFACTHTHTHTHTLEIVSQIVRYPYPNALNVCNTSRTKPQCIQTKHCFGYVYPKAFKHV